MPEGPALPFHSVPKWKWWLMDVGLQRLHAKLTTG